MVSSESGEGVTAHGLRTTVVAGVISLLILSSAVKRLCGLVDSHLSTFAFCPVPLGTQ